MMHDERIDFSALDPDAAPDAEERFVRGVMDRIADHAAPRGLGADPLIGVWSLVRSPALAAGILVVVAVGAFGFRIRREALATPTTIAEAMGVPAAFLTTPVEDGR